MENENGVVTHEAEREMKCEVCESDISDYAIIDGPNGGSKYVCEPCAEREGK